MDNAKQIHGAWVTTMEYRDIFLLLFHLFWVSIAFILK